MSFNFGNTSTFSNTSAPTSTGFGLGAGTSTTANKSAFGTSNFSFGAAANTTAPASTGFGTFGSGFGATPAPAQPAATGFGTFGSGFGSTPAAATTTTLTSGTTFGTGTGFTGFGVAPTTSTQSTGFGFGATFGQPAASAATGSLFSGFGQAQQPAVNTGFGGFGSTFGAKPAQTATTGGFGGFGSTLGGGATFGAGLGQQQPQPQLQVPASPSEALYNSIFQCNVYGDERDTTLSRWNLLQALWGTGKAFYSANAPPVDITPENPFCRFKAIGYNYIPAAENADGIVAIVFNKPEAEVKAQQTQLQQSLTAVLGNKPNLLVTVDSVKPVSDCKSQVLMHVQEKMTTGGVRKIPGAELAAYLTQPTQRQQLVSMSVESVFPQSHPGKEALAAYLETPPAGIDPRLWKQALADNPDDTKLVPVPMVGFGEVRWRMKCQEEETRRHQAFLDHVAEDIAQLKCQQSKTSAKAAEYRHKFAELEHRILRVLVQQEVSRKAGMSLTPEEEGLKSQLEALEAQVNTPTQFKGRLNEMLSQMRMQRQEAMHVPSERYAMDPGVQDDIKQFLLLEQNGMSHLVDTIQADMDSLKIIKEGMVRLLNTH